MALILYNGEVIGHDGNDDDRMSVIPNVDKSFMDDGPKLPGVGYGNKLNKMLVDFVRKNSGDLEAFEADDDIYALMYEIQNNSSYIESMNSIISNDNGDGGQSEANNREYGGYFTSDGVKAEEPGAVSTPDSGGASISMYQTMSSFHSHPSGTTADNRYIQQPSLTDITNKVNYKPQYVIGRGNNQIYIYNKDGIIAKMPYSKFLKAYGK